MQGSSGGHTIFFMGGNKMNDLRTCLYEEPRGCFQVMEEDWCPVPHETEESGIGEEEAWEDATDWNRLG